MKRANARGAQGGRGRPGGCQEGTLESRGRIHPPTCAQAGTSGASRAWVEHTRAELELGRGGQAPGAGGSLTDLAVRVGDVATAVKTRIMAILQRSAAEPVGPKGCSSGAV